LTTTALDQSLVSRAQAGESNAFNDLVRRYRARVLKTTLRYIHDRADAEDAVQEAFIRAYLGISRFRGECAFYTWLHRIAVNCVKTALYARARNADFFVSKSIDVDDGLPGAADWMNAETPEESVLTDEIYSVVNSAIGGLSEDQRTAICLRELEGLSYSQMAIAMACPIGTVRSRVARARDAIDGELRKVLDGGLGRLAANASMRCRPMRESAYAA